MTRADPKDIETPFEDERGDESRRSPENERPKAGFLPIETNWFDRIFISVVIWVALCLVWLRLLEPASLSLNLAHVIAVLLGIFIVWKG